MKMFYYVAGAWERERKWVFLVVFITKYNENEKKNHIAARKNCKVWSSFLRDIREKRYNFRVALRIFIEKQLKSKNLNSRVISAECSPLFLVIIADNPKIIRITRNFVTSRAKKKKKNDHFWPIFVLHQFENFRKIPRMGWLDDLCFSRLCGVSGFEREKNSWSGRGWHDGLEFVCLSAV